MKRLALLLAIVLLQTLSAQAQPYPAISFPVTVDGVEKENPFAGGLNNPQPNEVDLNQDGLMDLLIFDRTGNTLLPFLNSGGAYTYAPGYAAYFPELLGDWVILRDFNNDGVMDLFGQSQRTEFLQGIMVYTGYYENGHIAFERLPLKHPSNIIPFVLSNGTTTQLYVSNVDYPSIDDLDCDGDLDILTFNPAGGYIELFANQSVEEGYGRDSLIFRLVENCWGGIFENSIEQEVGLADNPGGCFSFQGGLTERHPGSTLLTFDADGDGDRELLLGDVTYSTLNFLHNGGSCEQAWVTEQELNFPVDGVTIDVPQFPVSFLADIDFDGLKDLLVAPNSVNISEDRNVLWVYPNSGTEIEPDFQYQQRDFLVGDMLDFGTGASPTFVDYNADGLLDLVVGTVGAFEPFGERDTRLFLFENTGTAQAPAFELVDEDYLGLSVFNSYTNFAPVFGDLDGDGDEDILVGEVLGRLFYAENTAGPGNPLSFGPWEYEYMDIDVGSLSVPEIVDLDRDGLPDLVIGERTGNINYFRNIGTASAPMFNSDPEVAPNQLALGNINTAVPGSISGYAAPQIIDQEGIYLLVAGTESGQLEVYNGIEGNLNGAFNLDTERMGDVRVGIRTRPAIADIDNDGKLEMIVGNERGGLNAFQTNLWLDSTSPASEADWASGVKIFPNPAREVLNVQLNQELQMALELVNTAGQVVLQQQQLGATALLPLSNVPAGVYFLRITAAGQRAVRKVVVW
ncbi:MAG: FG-GAP-like repeat-containing protein [Phaeodactylibacter sp.]|uniref:FG-GAP-like repeat-containing protein n=1 Tax=Phaeodactylibacter sp. TaxID=1940289 RepID=UPI0032ED1C6D